MTLAVPGMCLAAVLLTTAGSAIAPSGASAANQPRAQITFRGLVIPRMTPLGIETYLANYVAVTINFGQSFANGGAMNLIEHFYTGPHSVIAIAPCNSLSGNRANLVRLVRTNLKGDYEITCANGDAAAQHNFIPLRTECPDPTLQPNCKHKNIEPAQQYVGSKLEAYLDKAHPKDLHDAFGRVLRITIDDYSNAPWGDLGIPNNGKPTDAHVFFAKPQPGASRGARAVEEVSLFTVKSEVRVSVQLYG